MGKFRDSVDTRALRFAVGFPVVLAAAFVFCAFLLRPDLPDPVAISWTADGGASFAPFGAYAAGGALLIIAAGWLVLSQAVPLSRPAVMRRIMMGTGLFLSLFITSVLAAGLVGQAGLADARESRVDLTVLALGSGAALSLGVTMGFVFKADRQWSPEDDRALEVALVRELDPELAGDTLRLWVHARSSVFVMIAVACLFPAALIAVAQTMARGAGGGPRCCGRCFPLCPDQGGPRRAARPGGRRAAGHGRTGGSHLHCKRRGRPRGRLRRVGLPEPQRHRRDAGQQRPRRRRA